MNSNSALSKKKEGVIYPPLKEILSLIPKKYFKVNRLKSLKSFFISFFSSLFLLSLQIYLLNNFSLSWISIFILILNSICLGTAYSGIWVLGHECGHNNFSDSRKLDDFLGFFFHLFLFTPYFSWKRTHYIHHSGLNHLDRDGDFKPFNDFWLGKKMEIIKNKIGKKKFSVLFILFLYSVGFSYYFIIGLPGKLQFKSHFFPHKDIFTDKKLRRLVTINAICCLIFLALISFLTYLHPLVMIFCYIIPLFTFFIWVATYILLHHLSEGSYWYKNEWKLSKAIFQTTDRKYWSIINLLHHNIGRYHLYHHVSSRIPHYYAKDVTDIIIRNYPHLYRYSEENPIVSVFKLGQKALNGKKDSQGNIYLD